MQRRISPTTVIACAALFFSLAGTGIAASRYLITSKSQIKPSVRRELRGNVGPRGRAGLAGPQGATGANGPNGPSTSFTIVSATTIVPSDGKGAVLARCPDSTFPSGGGFEVDLGVIVLSSQPFSETFSPPLETGWLVRVVNSTASDQPVKSWASCASSPTPA